MTLDRQETIQVQCEFRHVKNKICRIRKCRNTFRTDGRPHLPRPSGFARRIRPTSELRGRGDIISHHRGKNYVRQRMGPNKIQKGQLILDLGVMEDLDLQLHNVPNILSLSGHAEYTRTLQNPCGSSPVTRSLKASRHETVNPQSYPPSDFLLPLHLGFHREIIIGSDGKWTMYYFTPDQKTPCHTGKNVFSSHKTAGMPSFYCYSATSATKSKKAKKFKKPPHRESFTNQGPPGYLSPN